AADAEVDDPRAVLDRVDDAARLVDVRERAVRPAGADHEQLCLAAEPGDPLVVADGTGRERGDERPVPVRVGDVGTARSYVVGRGGLRGEVRRAEIGAGVHDGDR